MDNPETHRLENTAALFDKARIAAEIAALTETHAGRDDAFRTALAVFSRRCVP